MSAIFAHDKPELAKT